MSAEIEKALSDMQAQNPHEPFSDESDMWDDGFCAAWGVVRAALETVATGSGGEEEEYPHGKNCGCGFDAPDDVCLYHERIVLAKHGLTPSTTTEPVETGDVEGRARKLLGQLYSDQGHDKLSEDFVHKAIIAALQASSRPQAGADVREGVIAAIRDRRTVRRFFGRRAIDKSCGEVVHDLDPDGPISDETFKVVERIDEPNFMGEKAAIERAEQLADEYTADAILSLTSGMISGEGWRTIESAPKDGSVFLGWHKLWVFPQPCCWESPVGDDGSHRGKTDAWVYADWALHNECDPSGVDITHWQLLPSPPAVEGEGA